MKSHRGKLNAYGYVKKATLKSHILYIWFQLYDILEKVKYKDSKTISVARDLEEERKGNMDTGAHRMFRVVKLFYIMSTVMVDSYVNMHFSVCTEPLYS